MEKVIFSSSFSQLKDWSLRISEVSFYTKNQKIKQMSGFDFHDFSFKAQVSIFLYTWRIFHITIILGEGDLCTSILMHTVIRSLSRLGWHSFHRILQDKYRGVIMIHLPFKKAS